MSLTMFSTSQASKALDQKNHVIHTLQLKITELANEVEAATFDATTHPLSVSSPARSSTDFSSGASSPSHSRSTSLLNAKLLLQLQETTAKLQQAEVENINKDKEIVSLSSELSTKEVELLEALSSTREQESAVQELAYMLAAREASHGALIDTVHAFVSQDVSSLPPTPRDLNTPRATTAGLPGEQGCHNSGAMAGVAVPEGAKNLEAVVSFRQERLEAQVVECSNASIPKEERSSSSGGGADLDVSLSKIVDDDNDTNSDDGSSSNDDDDDDIVTSPTDKKTNNLMLPSLSAASPLGPVTPI